MNLGFSWWVNIKQGEEQEEERKLAQLVTTQPEVAGH